ncbi:MAG TPA: MBL fold metallo-hydrolase [Treponema sp.]|nr:MBL fold metallo-hydrolase [Treponema sp.]
MKIYFHLNLGGFSNCYVVANESIKEAIIIDPGRITEEIIDTIENGSYKLTGVFITHNHGSHVHGLKTLRKIYTPKIYAADWEVAGNDTNVITGDGKVRIAGLSVRYMALPGHTADSMVYKIGTVLFTGDAISAGKIGTTNNSYSDFILRNNIERKIFSQQDGTVLMPGHGPPTCVGVEKLYNLDMVRTADKNAAPIEPLPDE